MKNILLSLSFIFCAASISAQKIPNYSSEIQMENLGRGFTAYRASKSGSSAVICLSWRYLKSDAPNKTFKVYKTPVLNGVEGAKQPVVISGTTDNIVKNATFIRYSEFAAPDSAKYFYLHEVVNGVENPQETAKCYLGKKTGASNTELNYIEIPMKPVNAALYDGTFVYSATAKDSAASSYAYIPNDASFADLDGDGEMEIVVHRVGPRAQDNANSGKTDAPVLQAYKLDGTFMWEINLGQNIREGAHYTQFMVYDLDGDGKAEVVCKTAEGSRDALGTWVGEAYAPTYKQKHSLTSWNFNPNVVYRNSSGYILTGPEFLTVFNGETGAEIVTTEYDPPRYSTVYNNGNEVPVLNPSTANINSRWGDNYGNRVDRFLACIAYLDGIHPSVVMCRGYYTRTVLVAYDFDGTNLTKRWKFDTYAGSGTSQWAAYAGQGNHNLRVGDVDGDGKDEIIYGSMAVDDDGRGLYNTRLGHGDAMHLTDFDPTRPGLEVFACHESGNNGVTLREAATGRIIKQYIEPKKYDKNGKEEPVDVGRCMATDINGSSRGMEFWGGSQAGGIISAITLQNVGSTSGTSSNMAAWWDGDLLRELQDGVSITKYGVAEPLLSPAGVSSNNSTKANPCIVADILGDWREELVVRTTNNKAIRIYMTDQTTNYRFHSFLQDPVYRLSVAYQNVAYNQPTHTGFYMGADLANIFVPTQIIVDTAEYTLDAVFDAISYSWNTGDSTRAITLKREDYADGEFHNIKLDMNYHGYIFSDSVKIKFNIPNKIQNTTKDKIAISPNPVANELSLHFAQAGLYDCYFYDTAGKLVMKTTLTVSGKSVQTIDVSSLPAGNGILQIENKNQKYKMKFIKK